MGWFGPRGLASIVFVVLVQDEMLPGSEILATTVTWTILLSVLLHGLSANALWRRTKHCATTAKPSGPTMPLQTRAR